MNSSSHFDCEKETLTEKKRQKLRPKRQKKKKVDFVRLQDMSRNPHYSPIQDELNEIKTPPSDSMKDEVKEEMMKEDEKEGNEIDITGDEEEEPFSKHGKEMKGDEKPRPSSSRNGGRSVFECIKETLKSAKNTSSHLYKTLTSAQTPDFIPLSFGKKTLKEEKRQKLRPKRQKKKKTKVETKKTEEEEEEECYVMLDLLDMSRNPHYSPVQDELKETPDFIPLSLEKKTLKEEKKQKLRQKKRLRETNKVELNFFRKEDVRHSQGAPSSGDSSSYVQDMFRNPHHSLVQDELIEFKTPPSVSMKDDEEVMKEDEKEGDETVDITEDDEEEEMKHGKETKDGKKPSPTDEKAGDTIFLENDSDDDVIVIDDDDVPALPCPTPAPSSSSHLSKPSTSIQTPDFIPLTSLRKPLKRLRADVNKFLEHKRLRADAKKFLKDSKRKDHQGGPSSSSKVIVSQGPTMMTANSESQGTPGSLRPIVIDGSNVAMTHGMGQFSVMGIQIVINYFKSRGHTKIVAFLPEFKRKHDHLVLQSLASKGLVVFTPSRVVDGERITSYDDTFILDYAAAHGGVVVTRDNFRDLANKKAEWKEVIQNRILMPTFVGDDLMFPHDPLGQHGPNLDTFLRF